MKRINTYLFCLLTIVFLASCSSNKKLKQENAEKSIKEFLSKNIFEHSPDNKAHESYSIINAEKIKSIEPLSQFTETEASTIAHFDFKYAENYIDFEPKELSLKFSFKKNIDNQWILTSVDSKDINNENWLEHSVERYWLNKYHNLNIIAQ